MKPHKHAELIKAWADGAQIQHWNVVVGEWMDCSDRPAWQLENRYRVKPESKPDLVYYGVFDCTGAVLLHGVFTKMNDRGDQIKVTFDGESMKLKSAEVL